MTVEKSRSRKHAMACFDIIIPTFNRSAVLPKTLRSVQNQTFSDWRCFIAEDGKTQENLAAVTPFLKDNRFIYLPGRHAGCPAAPRNRAIRTGDAPFIAFLDDDDLWLPEKLATQLQFMEQNPICVLLGTNAYRWNGSTPIENSAPLFSQTLHTGKITFETLLARNPLINSTAVLRRSILSRSGMLNEDPELAAGEDYELWLRVAPLGEVWVLDKVLAAYRDAPQASIRASLTPQALHKKYECIFSAALRGTNTTPSPLTYPEHNQLALQCRRRLAQLRQRKMQQKYLIAHKTFTGRVKRYIMACGRFMGRLASFFIKSSDRRPLIFMIFPDYHTGGSERVHADIISCLRDYRPWVIIVRTSNNKAFKKAFACGGRLIDLSLLCERKPVRVLFLVMVNFLAELLNRAENAVVFGSNAMFFYDFLPLLSKKVKKIDLIHAFDGLEKYSLPCVPLLDVRVGINKKVLSDLTSLYQENGIHMGYLKKVRIIENRTSVPRDYQAKPPEMPTVLYVGRGTVEKRVHLVGKIAKRCVSENPGMRFILAGDMRESVLPEDRQFCIFAGELLEREPMERLYEQSHLLLLTSEREGMPLVIMEAMAHGVVPIATDVGGIREHVADGANGFLVYRQDEEAIVEDFAEKIQRLLGNRKAYEQLSRNAHQYALSNFTNTAFCDAYAGLLTSAKEL